MSSTGEQDGMYIIYKQEDKTETKIIYSLAI